MTAPGRYLRLFLAFARFGLLQELSFRANFLVKLFVEALWLGILLLFYELIFSQRENMQVAGWDRNRYLFFVGCHYALGGVIETFFMENCTGFADMVRSGDLDVYLLRPIDEQFLITCRHIDWSTAPNILQGAAVMGYALWAMPWAYDPGRLALFALLFVAGCALAYSFLLMLSCTAIWLVRNQSLLEMWWLFTTLMRYPREIFRGAYVQPVAWFFTFVLPVLLVVSVPADTMVRTLDPRFVTLMLVAAAVMLLLSRAVFRKSLQSYRSASS